MNVSLLPAKAACALLCLLFFISACRNSHSAPDNLVNDVTIDVQVQPNPPVVGESILLITLSSADGEPIDDATIQVRGDMTHAGMVPVFGDVSGGQDGDYQVPFEWSMGGDWALEVTATLPDDGGTAQRTLEVAVGEPIAGRNVAGATSLELTQAAQAWEFAIVIPDGTQALIEAGQDPGVIPTEIYLSLQDQNVLVIVNNDHADHVVGPFFVRSGETIRQEFTRPGVYEGSCSIHPGNTVRLVVED